MRAANLLRCLACVLAAFSGWTLAQNEAENHDNGIRLEDDLGRPVELNEPARRIVSLSPHITELLYEIGAGELIVGADEYSNFPTEAQQIPRIGNSDNIDYEMLLAQQPDLVIGWHSGNGMQHIQQLIDLGLTLYINEPKRLSDIHDTLLAFGSLTGNRAEAQTKAVLFAQRLNELTAQYADKELVSVFYQVWHEPLITLNGDHILSDLITMCGGYNISAELPNIAPRVNLEAVIDANPDVIISGGPDKRAPPWLQNWRQWPNLTAVKQNQIYFVESDHTQRHSSRILLGAEQICGHLEQARQTN